MPNLDRRAFITALTTVLSAASLGRARAQDDPLVLGPPRDFSFETLIADARRAASEPHRPPQGPPPEALDRIDYDAHWRIRFRESAAPRLGDDALPIHFFHLGRYAREPVEVSLLENGLARAIRYDPALFASPPGSPARALGPGAGFAGFRIMRPDHGPDWISFLGASYFRCDGPERQYGLSARGLALDTGLSRPEEFPRFSAFWIGEGEGEGEDAVIYARLDSASATGAYRIAARLGEAGQRCDVAARLFFRSGVERLGVAPLTSMFWYSETNRSGVEDWRPEVHDSDGLALETGAGERLWRPLRNPHRVTTTSFLDDGPRGFGLIQRDRAFAHYQDDGVFYHRRPSAWVAPRGDWGRGAVRLVEIPTADETFDNVVAFWSPDVQPAAGDARAYDYAIEWRERDPAPPGLGRVVATWSGLGGVPGQPIPEGVLKYVVDFEGGELDRIDEGVELELEARGGRIIRPSVHRVVGRDRWRAIFDLDGAFERPVELRGYLRRGGEALTETWTLLVERDGGASL